MKKIFTLTCIALFSISFSFAQTIISVPNDSAYVTANVADQFDLVESHIHIVNNTALPTTYSWRMLNYTAPVPPWELKLCDNNNCYDLLIGNFTRVSNTVSAHDTMDMKFQFSPHCVTGTANVNILVYATGDSANENIILNYKADLTTSCPNAIVDVTKNNLTIYPNPVQNSFTVSGLENTGNFSFEVFDMKGAIVKSEIKGATNNTIEISIENLPVGTYVLKAFDKNGKVAGTARLSKQD